MISTTIVWRASGPYIPEEDMDFAVEISECAICGSEDEDLFIGRCSDPSYSGAFIFYVGCSCCNQHAERDDDTNFYIYGAIQLWNDFQKDIEKSCESLPAWRSSSPKIDD